jgi:hypothetical protein
VKSSVSLPEMAMFRLAMVPLLLGLVAGGLAGCHKGGDGGTPMPPRQAWTFVGSSRFDLLPDPVNVVRRTAGIGFDIQSNNVIFSGATPIINGHGRGGLEVADINYSSIRNNDNAITSAFDPYGSNHMGCIDVFGGQIIAPLEDSDNFLHPILAKYNPSDLSYTGEFALLPRDADQDDGVPWVAVNSAKNLVYTMKFKNATKLNIFDLNALWSTTGNGTSGTGVNRQGQLTLSRPLSGVQCGKVSGNSLYVFSTDMTVKSINLDSGVVSDVFNLTSFGVVEKGTFESEGLAFFPGKNGSTLHLTGILTPNGSNPVLVPNVTVYDFQLK